jgi:hypothetical protein
MPSHLGQVKFLLQTSVLACIQNKRAERGTPCAQSLFPPYGEQTSGCQMLYCTHIPLHHSQLTLGILPVSQDRSDPSSPMHVGITASDCPGRERYGVQVERRILRTGEGNESRDTGQWSPGDTTGEGLMAHSHNRHKSAGDLGKAGPIPGPLTPKQLRPDSQSIAHSCHGSSKLPWEDNRCWGRPSAQGTEDPPLLMPCPIPGSLCSWVQATPLHLRP